MAPAPAQCLPPYCRVPEKRDFMDYRPERRDEDFYRDYDPMIGIGTAGILLAFIAFITVKSLIRYAIRRWRKRRYFTATTSGAPSDYKDAWRYRDEDDDQRLLDCGKKGNVSVPEVKVKRSAAGNTEEPPAPKKMMVASTAASKYMDSAPKSAV